MLTIKPEIVSTRGTILATVALAAVLGLLLVGCGDSESVAGNSSTSKTYIVKSRDRISPLNAPSRATMPEDEEDDEVNPSGADPIKPCSLVTSSEASAILGVPVQVAVGSQGPTCIYTTPGSKSVMTLVVERVSLASLREHAAAATRVDVAGRPGWCIRYGSTSVAVPLPDGSVLNVTGKCDPAKRFAARALPRIAT